MDETAALAERIRTLIREGRFDHNEKLPTERALGVQFGVSRNRVRSALRLLEADGLIWRHVGRGTFVGARPVLNLEDVRLLGVVATPQKVLEARIAFEPMLAELAAVNATAGDLDTIVACAARCRLAPDWRGYEGWDNKLHDAVAKATRNKLLIHLFETVNSVRRSMAWRQPRDTVGPGPGYLSFAQHDAIVAAIARRDGTAAAAAMRAHLVSVRHRILPRLEAAASGGAAAAARLTGSPETG